MSPPAFVDSRHLVNYTARRPSKIHPSISDAWPRLPRPLRIRPVGNVAVKPPGSCTPLLDADTGVTKEGAGGTPIRGTLNVFTEWSQEPLRKRWRRVLYRYNCWPFLVKNVNGTSLDIDVCKNALAFILKINTDVKFIWLLFLWR